MAYGRREAVNRCGDLGRQFVSHFIKTMKSPHSSDFHHHCLEMQTWWNDVSELVLKSTKKKLTKTQLIDWFFTKGSLVEIIIPEEFQNQYKTLIKDLLSGRSVEESMKELISQMGD